MQKINNKSCKNFEVHLIKNLKVITWTNDTEFPNYIHNF